jgi:hypothetical protein
VRPKCEKIRTKGKTQEAEKTKRERERARKHGTSRVTSANNNAISIYHASSRKHSKVGRIAHVVSLLRVLLALRFYDFEGTCRHYSVLISRQVVTVLGSPAICPHSIAGSLVRRLQGRDADS